MRFKRKNLRPRLLLSSIVFLLSGGHKQRNLTLLCPLIVFHSQVSYKGYLSTKRYQKRIPKLSSVTYTRTATKMKSVVKADTKIAPGATKGTYPAANLSGESTTEVDDSMSHFPEKTRCSFCKDWDTGSWMLPILPVTWRSPVGLSPEAL